MFLPTSVAYKSSSLLHYTVHDDAGYTQVVAVQFGAECLCARINVGGTRRRAADGRSACGDARLSSPCGTMRLRQVQTHAHRTS